MEALFILISLTIFEAPPKKQQKTPNNMVRVMIIQLN